MDTLDLLADLIARARAAGADAADAVLIAGTSLGVQRRLGKTEHVERSEGRDLGLRVFVGKRAAIVVLHHGRPGRLRHAGRARGGDGAGWCRRTPMPAWPRPPRRRRTPRSTSTTPAEPDTAALLARAGLAEDAALAVPGVNNSEGASAGYGRTEAFLVTSAGFAGRPARTSHSVSATALAGTGTGMQRDYDHHSDGAPGRPRRSRPRSAAAPGERAVARLNPTRPATAKLPVVYDPRVVRRAARAFRRRDQRRLGRARHVVPEGQAGRRASSPPGIAIHDDPRRVRGLRSRAVRRRGHADRRTRADRGRRADHLAARQRAPPASSACAPPATPRAAPAARRRRRRPTCIWRPGR